MRKRKVRVVAAAVVFRHGRLLLLHRNKEKKTFPSLWHIARNTTAIPGSGPPS